MRSTKSLFSDIIPEENVEETNVGRDKYRDILVKYEKFHKKKFR